MKEIFGKDGDEAEAKSFFEEVKDGLAADYRKHQEIINEPDLIKSDYLALKNFEKRSNMGRRTERENYLRMFSIREFRDIAPTIIEVGRKVRYARRKYEKTGDEVLKSAIIRQKYFLREDVEEGFEALTGIEENPAKVIDMIVNAQCVKNKAFQKFQGSQAESLREAYDNGLFAKKNLRHLVNNFGRMQKEEVVELDEKTKERLAKIREYSDSEFVDITYTGKVEKRLEGIEVRDKVYVPKRFIGIINKVYNDLERVLDYSGLKKVDQKEFAKTKARLAEKGRVLYVGEKDNRLVERRCDVKGMKATTRTVTPVRFWIKDKGYEIKADYVDSIEKAVKDIEAGAEVDEEFLKKFDSLNVRDLRLVGEKGSFDSHNLRWRRKEYDRIVLSEGLKERIESVYEKIQGFKENPMYQSAEKRREIWEKEQPNRRWMLSQKLKGEIYKEIVEKDVGLQKMIGGLAGGWLEYGRLKRTHSYSSKNPHKFDLTFSRFMSDGQNLRSNRLANGDVVEFRVHKNIKGYLEQDLKAKNIDQGQYDECQRRINQFEQDVNGLLLEKYLRNP